MAFADWNWIRSSFSAGAFGLVIVVLLAGACGDDGTATPGQKKGEAGGSSTSSGAFAGSCSNQSSGFCNEFTGSRFTPKAVEDNCKSLGTGITYLSGRCPTENLVGTCIVYKGSSMESYYRYYASFPGTSSASTESAAKAGKDQCTSPLKGQWLTP